MESAQPVLTVRSVEDALVWFRDVLQLEAGFVHRGPDHPANYAVLSNGGAGLHLGLEQDMENVAGQGACNFVAREFDELYQRARHAGATFFIELSEIPTGARTFGIKDPDGNLITIVEAS
jgi:uncharacterized glyoxalase superfamily protein PhnB